MQLLWVLLILLTPASLLAQEVTVPTVGGPLKEEVAAIHQLAGEGKLDEAIRRLTTLLAEVNVDRIRLQYDLANLLFVQGRYREARGAYQKVLLLAEEENDLVLRSRERIAKMKERETKKKDEFALRLIDIETALDAGQLPPSGAKEFLKSVEQNPTSLYREKAEELMRRIHDKENELARVILNEARRLFDQDKNYLQVISLLETVQRDYPDTEEMDSVKILLEETERRLHRTQRGTASQVPSLQEAR